MKKLSLLLMLGTVLNPWSANATDCVATPDCASLGYTMDASKCSGAALKCPWDTSKAACKEKEALKSQLPILYGDGTVSKNIVSGKTPIGIVYDEANKLAVALSDIDKDGRVTSGTMTWGAGVLGKPGGMCTFTAEKDCETLNASGSNCAPDSQKNTQSILSTTQIITDGYGTKYTCKDYPYAAIGSQNYTPSGCSKEFCSKTKWFVPSMQELQKIYSQKATINSVLNSLRLGNKLQSGVLCSSNTSSSYKIWTLDFTQGIQNKVLQNSTCYLRPVIYYGEPKAGCDAEIAAAGATKVTTAAELKAANRSASKILMMNDISLGSEDLTVNAPYISWPGEFASCSASKRPTLTAGNVTFLEGIDHALGVNLKASSLTTTTNGTLELYDVTVNRFQDNNGKNVWFYGNASIGTWAANVTGGAYLFGADGGRLGVVKGGAWNTMDENRIIKITISSFTYMKGSPVVYGAGWNQLDNADISIPADMFNSIYGPVDLEYNAKVTVNGSITSCNAEVYFYSTGDSNNKSCFNDICPMQNQNCSQITNSQLRCNNGVYSCQ